MNKALECYSKHTCIRLREHVAMISCKKQGYTLRSCNLLMLHEIEDI